MSINIDAVYTWVDMSDNNWTEKYKKITKENPTNNRFKNYGELEYSVKLLQKNCSFIRKIFIVTDNQIPKWYDSKIHNNIIIIDHSQILGNECCKPTFNSDSIEAYLWKIPDLSEYYIYLNDDCFIGNKCSISNFINMNNKLPYARFVSIGLNNTVKIQAISGLVYSRAAILTNAVNCIENKFGIHYNLAPLHQATIMRKSIGKLAWEYFYKELKLSVMEPTRKNKFISISFTNLSLLLGIVTKNMIPEIGKYSINVYSNYSLSKGGHQYNFNCIMNKKPQLFCINDINDFNYPYFKKFIESYTSSIKY